jgi:hypothetical protein
VYTLRKGKGDTLESWETVNTEIGERDTLERREGVNTEIWEGRYA